MHELIKGGSLVCTGGSQKRIDGSHSAKYSVTTFGSSKGLTFDRVLIYPTQPMLNWLSGKSKDMKAESLSKFYVAVTRAKYSVAFVYKTKKIPSEDIGEMWIDG
ncbi:MAG: 3'-5' exonuclease [Waltera sp.]|uniref:3'-5' exonuclease n=1 Tax=Waltera sp. TaxID=2815806 RepID=UPI0039921D6A